MRRVRTQEREQHDGWLKGTHRVRQMSGHPDPRSWSKLNGVAIQVESDPTKDDLHDGRLRRRVISELLPLIESKHHHSHEVVSVENLTQRSLDRYRYLFGDVEKHGGWRFSGHHENATRSPDRGR